MLNSDHTSGPSWKQSIRQTCENYPTPFLLLIQVKGGLQVIKCLVFLYISDENRAYKYMATLNIHLITP